MATKQKTTVKNKTSKVRKVSKPQPVSRTDNNNLVLALMVAFTVLSIWFATLAFVNYG